jgi:hypothetical protein
MSVHWLSHDCPMRRPTVEQIAVLLSEDWDPIGVAQIDESPEREYHFEATELATMLSQGATVGDIVDYLGSRGLGQVDAARDRVVAAKLLALRE